MLTELPPLKVDIFPFSQESIIMSGPLTHRTLCRVSFVCDISMWLSRLYAVYDLSIWTDRHGQNGKTHITKTCLYNFDPVKPHFYIVKLGFTGVCIIFLISAQKHRLWVLVRTASQRRF